MAQALAQGKIAILSKGSAHDEFQSPQLRFYGAPLDVEGLASEMEKSLSAATPARLIHNISTQDKMVEETLDVYNSAQ